MRDKLRKHASDHKIAKKKKSKTVLPHGQSYA